MNCENAIRNFENAIMNRENAIMNQLPSEIFLLRSVSFLIKLSCKKLPPSLVKCVFLLYPRQVKMPNVHLNFFCLIFRWDEKLDIKIWFYCFQFPRVQILLFVGWNSIRVKKSFVHSLLLYCWRVGKWRRHDTAATNFRQRKCLSQSTGTLLRVVKIPLLNFKDLLQKRLWPGRPTRGPFFTPVHTRLQIEVFVCFRLFC